MILNTTPNDMNMANKDYYKILGVSKSATDDEIKKAFRTLAHKHHPDKQGGDEKKFKEANEAYQVLSDKTKRQQYDQFGSEFVNQPGAGGAGAAGGGFNGQGFEFNFGNMEDLGDLFGVFGDMFGFGGGNRGAHGRAGGRVSRGNDVAVDAELTLEEAATGITRTFNLNKLSSCETCGGSGAAHGSNTHDCKHCGGKGQIRTVQNTILGAMQSVAQCPDCRGAGKKPEKECATCHGTGAHKRAEELTINIPAGIDDGQSIRVSGRGEAAVHGGTQGDLYIRVHVKRHKFLERDGETIYSHIHISFPTAALGGEARTHTLGGEVTIKIPEGIESGESIRLREKGIAYRGGRGDHIVRVTVDTPKKVSKTARKLLEQLRDEMEG